jgi:hypothetical protein
MAIGVQSAPPAPPRKRPTSKRGATVAPPHQMSAWRGTLIILLAFCMVGIVPLVIVAEATGHLAFPSFSLPLSNPFSATTPTPTDAPDLALPRDAWVTRSVDVLPHPGQGAALATLAPAFPVRLLQHQRVGNTLWSRIEWTGPVHSMDGAGWVPNNLLDSNGHTGAILGDLGALSPALRQAVSPYARQFSAVVYIPSQRRLYNAGGMDNSLTLGTGFRPMLLSALYGEAEAKHTSVSLMDALLISHSDASGTPRIYQQLGGASGLSTYLGNHAIAGFQTDPTWSACQATPRAMMTFYAQLAGNLLTKADTTSVVSILSLADAATTSNLTASWARTAGNLLVVGVAPTGNTWTVSVAGILNPPNGPQVIVVAVATGQSSSDGATPAMKAFYQQLTSQLAG